MTAKIEVVAFQPEHLQKIALKACHDGELTTGVSTDAVTFLKDGEPVAIFGWFMIATGVLQLWSLLSEEIRTTPIAFHKSVKLFIRYAFEKYRLRRMQFSVKVGFSEGWKWAHSLGFKCEGIMKHYGAGSSDCWLFARVA